MRKTPFVIFLIFAAICVIVIPYVAISSGGSQDAAVVEVEPRDREARDLLATNCGSCHRLAAAGTDGVVGPDLDSLLVPTGVNSPESYESIYSRVLNAIQCGIGGRMPRGILIGEDARDVAQFVGAYAGQIGKGPTVDTSDPEQAPAEDLPADC